MPSGIVRHGARRRGGETHTQHPPSFDRHRRQDARHVATLAAARCTAEGPLLQLAASAPSSPPLTVVAFDVTRHMDDRRYSLEALRRDGGKWSAALRHAGPGPVAMAHPPLLGVDGRRAGAGGAVCSAWDCCGGRACHLAAPQNTLVAFFRHSDPSSECVLHKSKPTHRQDHLRPNLALRDRCRACIYRATFVFEMPGCIQHICLHVHLNWALSHICFFLFVMCAIIPYL